jgi:asparagine synthase (glutamine-hydrolysing)
MSQLLIAQGDDPRETKALFDRGVEAFERIYQLRPADSVDYAAVFPNYQGKASPVIRTTATPGWICGVGCWFFEGVTGEAGLRKIAEGSRDNAGEWLQNIDGTFVLALRDGVTGKLVVVTDRLGTLHVYTAQLGAAVLICTSSLVLAALIRPAWDFVGCREFLATGTIFESRTQWEGIEKLPPAGLFEFFHGKPSGRRKYWKLADHMYDGAPERGDVPKLAAALRESGVEIGRNFPRPLFDLTGGLDSRCVVGAAVGVGVALETTVNGPGDSPDVLAAAEVARYLGLRHHHNMRGFASAGEWWQATGDALRLCDGEQDAVQYASTVVPHRASAGAYDASVNGSNGEVCKGYWWELLFPFTRWRSHFDARKVAAGRFVYAGEAPELLAAPYQETLTDLFAGIIERAGAGLERHLNTAKLDNVYLTLRMQRWQGRIASSTMRIWPCVSPFTFRRPMELALATPAFDRLRNRMSRRMVEYLDPRLAALPLAEGYPASSLRPWNAHRFLAPAAKLVAEAVRPRLGLHSHSANPGRPNLWQVDEVGDLLEPARMASRELYQAKTLGALIVESRKQPLDRPQLVTRILTLEMLARMVKQA